MTKKTKVAVIGCGTIAHGAHIPAYLKNPDVEIKYFCDIIPERADAAVEKYGCGKAVYNYSEILSDDDLDAVSICTHNDYHSVASIDFMRAGKHVLSEKPVAKTLSEALEMQKVAHETGKILSVGVCNRFGTAVNKIKELIADGELGNVYHIYLSFRGHRGIPGLGGAFTTKAITGGGVLIDSGVHYIDLALYCCGSPSPLSVSAECYSKIGTPPRDYVTASKMWAQDTANLDGIFDVEDCVTALVRTSGPSISLNGAWAQNIGEKDCYIDFLGDKAGIRLQYLGNFTLYSVKNGMLLRTEPDYLKDDFYEEEVNSFIDCVRNGGTNRQYIDKVMDVAKIIQGIYDSSELHKEVTV